MVFWVSSSINMSLLTELSPGLIPLKPANQPENERKRTVWTCFRGFHACKASPIPIALREFGGGFGGALVAP